jgi:hypothetical protein
MRTHTSQPSITLSFTLHKSYILHLKSLHINTYSSPSLCLPNRSLPAPLETTSTSLVPDSQRSPFRGMKHLSRVPSTTTVVTPTSNLVGSYSYYCFFDADEEQSAMRRTPSTAATSSKRGPVVPPRSLVPTQSQVTKRVLTLSPRTARTVPLVHGKDLPSKQ